MSSEGTLIWATPGPSANQGVVEAAARDLDLAVRFSTHQELVERLRNERCSVACIEFGYDAHPGLTLLKQVLERMPRLTVVVASNDASVTMIRAVLEAGAADFLSLPLNVQELSKVFIKLSALTNADGGLVDLDLQRGDVAAFLNLTPLNSIATIAAATGPVDDIFLAGTLTRHPRGVFVLPAPTQVEEAETVSHDHVELTLELFRTQFRYTLVDTSRTVSGPMLAAFEQSDRILVLTDLSVPGVRAARRLMELLQRLNISLQRIEPIFSHVIPGPVSTQDAARAVGKDPLAVMPRDDAAASGAMNGGIPLNGKQSALPFAISDLAAKLSGLTAPTRPKGLLQRVFSKEARK